MFEVDGTNIKLTRGDSFYCQLTVNQGEDPYVFQEGDELRFALKRKLMTPGGGNYADCEALITKTIPTDTLILALAPADTKALKFGSYDYDIQLTFADGAVDTFINGDFEILPEVS